MEITVNYTYRTRIEENLTLSKVWNIEDRELSKIAFEALKIAESKEGLRKLFFKNALGSLCLVEFLDMLPLVLPKKGPFININYLYCEGVSVFREATLAGINNLFHASFSALRSALELIVYHIWWQKKLEKSDHYLDFYSWLYGTGKKPVSFVTVYSEIYESLMFPSSAADITFFKKIYSTLCAYAHKPMLKESIISIKESNDFMVCARLLDYWSSIANDFLRIIIDMLVAFKPQILFPKEIWRKFGFNYPIGVFFDHSNYLPFKAWLGQKRINEYKALFSKDKNLIALLKDYEKKADLPDDSIFASWPKEELVEDSPSDSAETKIILRWALLKATQRTQTKIFPYLSVPHDIEWKNGDAIVQKVEFE